MQEAEEPKALMLTWEGAFHAGPLACGAKAYNLARLHRYGFRVPTGGVLTSEAYLVTLKNAVAKQAIQNGHHVELPDGLRREVRHFLDSHNLANTPVAVRSSATGEDSHRASFAGIHHSVLNVRGVEAIESAIVACYRSLWTERARAYREKMDFSDDEIECALVICRMVRFEGSDQPLCAGVAFTADPISGRRDVVLIDAAPGSGLAVVSGHVNPSRFMFRIDRGHPVLEQSDENLTLLTSNQLEELAWTADRIQWALGDGQDPQDIEWAHDGKELWILQSRPITRLPRPGSERLLKLPRYWSTANIKDSAPGVLCELSWSNLRELVQTVAFAAIDAVGYQLPKGLELVRRFHGRVYFDLTLMQWAFFDGFGVLPELVTRFIGGHQPNIQTPPGDPLKGPEGRRRRKTSLRLFRVLWSFEKKHASYFERYINEMRTLAKERLSSKRVAELRGLMKDLEASQWRLAPLAGLANSAYGRWLTPLEQILERKFGAGGKSLLAALSSASAENVSAEQGYRIVELARIVRGDGIAASSLSSPSDSLLLKDLPSDSPFRIAVEDFLAEFGHRATSETNIQNPRWIEDPTSLLNQIRDSVSASDVDLRALAVQRRLAAEKELRNRMPLAWPLLRWMANGLRRAYAIRELSKSALVAGLLPYRKLVLEIGERLVSQGQLDQPEQVFDLTASDLRNWLRGYWDGHGACELSNDRSEQRKVWSQEDAPDVIAGEDATEMPLPVQFTPENIWRGAAVSAGQATGVARIIRSPHEGAKLSPNEILVAPSTDPGWTPLFLKASAIVMEIGGYLSHGAIVAREYGLPAVVNIPGVLKQINDGDMIAVNGDDGTVMRVKEQCPCSEPS